MGTEHRDCVGTLQGCTGMVQINLRGTLQLPDSGEKVKPDSSGEKKSNR